MEHIATDDEESPTYGQDVDEVEVYAPRFYSLAEFK